MRNKLLSEIPKWNFLNVLRKTKQSLKEERTISIVVEELFNVALRPLCPLKKTRTNINGFKVELAIAIQLNDSEWPRHGAQEKLQSTLNNQSNFKEFVAKTSTTFAYDCVICPLDLLVRVSRPPCVKFSFTFCNNSENVTPDFHTNHSLFKSYNLFIQPLIKVCWHLKVVSAFSLAPDLLCTKSHLNLLSESETDNQTDRVTFVFII